MKKCRIAGMMGLLIVCATPLVGCGEGPTPRDAERVTVAPTEAATTTEEPTLKPTLEPTVEPTMEPTAELQHGKKRKASNFIVVDDPLLDLDMEEFNKKYARLPDDYKIRIGEKENVIFSFLDENGRLVLKHAKEDGIITKGQAARVSEIIMLYNVDDTDDIELTPLSLRGLRYFRNVESFDMERKILSDYSELGYLKSLVGVNFSSCKFDEGETEELSCLFTMPGMEEVSLGGGLANVDFLSGFSDLGGLHVSLGGEFSDVSGLSSLKRVGCLSLGSENLTDISALSNLMEVDELVLGHTQISDISALSNLTEVAKLDLSYNQISDITPLSKLTDMGSLILNNNQITDVTPLSGLRKIHTLGLSYNPITDVSPLRNLEFVEIEDAFYPGKPGIGLANTDVDQNATKEIFGDYYVTEEQWSR